MEVVGRGPGPAAAWPSGSGLGSVLEARAGVGPRGGGTSLGRPGQAVWAV